MIVSVVGSGVTLKVCGGVALSGRLTSTNTAKTCVSCPDGQNDPSTDEERARKPVTFPFLSTGNCLETTDTGSSTTPLLVAFGRLPPLLKHSQKNDAWATVAVIVATSAEPKTSLKSIRSVAVRVIPLVVAVLIP